MVYVSVLVPLLAATLANVLPSAVPLPLLDDVYLDMQLFDVDVRVITYGQPRIGNQESTERSRTNALFCTRGDTIPDIQVNGMDVLAMCQATVFAKHWVAEEKCGPLLIEFVHVSLRWVFLSRTRLLRFLGDILFDVASHLLCRVMLQNVRPNDDIPLTRREESGVAAIDNKVRAEVDKAAEEAQASPEA
ncbi:hypothetical protein FISHEDRAFT_73876 [Fistulina hepatica ATCC 64428]|uniref:Dehydrogenase E1 component domain-containing protein n=1 Tax=Fistulina hepatica ATCC 64428 TaxID=1128425 RepID=A0A0D7AD63_9AGAR|nr:hypothetical protein FISHEDRAFT_73876 [Fistulina hepatica ATCC 64428]